MNWNIGAAAGGSLLIAGCFALAPEVTGRCTHNNDCDGGTLCDVATGFCTPVCWGHLDCPRGFVCQGYCVAYPLDCADNGDACVEGTFCQDGECRKVLSNGAECAGAHQCFTGHCVDGVCCNLPCAGLCESCNVVENQAADGQCLPVAAGVDMHDECPGQLACNGMGGCFSGAGGDMCAADHECVVGRCELASCTLCGDGLVTGHEECDDGNTADDGNGCDGACRANNDCGNGEVESAMETCDDGNAADGDGCSGECHIEPGWTCNGEPSACVRLLFVDAKSTAVAPDGGDWSQAFPRLQDALAFASATFGESEAVEIWVAEGRYTPGDDPENTFLVTGTVGVYGGFEGTEFARDERDIVARPTILSGLLQEADGWGAAKHSHHVVTVAPNSAVVLDGLVIRDGRAHQDASSPVGGGVFGVASIQNCWLTNNRAVRGGAVAMSAASSTDRRGYIKDSWLWDNHATSNGGAVHEVEVIENSVFENNSAAAYGGAVFGTTHIRGVVFRHNSAWIGGAVTTSHFVELSDSEFVGNMAIHCGGFRGYSHSALIVVIPTVDNSLFQANRAVGAGGGACLGNFEVHSGNLQDAGNAGVYRIDNSLFMDNQAALGGGLHAGMRAVAVYGDHVYVQVTDSWFEGNRAEYGGAISGASIDRYLTDPAFVHGNIVFNLYSSEVYPIALRRTVLSNNVATEQGGGFYGIAVELHHSQIIGNRAHAGAGMTLVGDFRATYGVENSLIAHNYATDKGGGILALPHRFADDPLAFGPSRIQGSFLTIAFNYAGAPQPAPTARGAALWIDMGGLTGSDVDMSFVNSIVTHNFSDGSLGDVGIVGAALGDVLTLTNSLVSAPLTGLGSDNFSADPLFVNPQDGNLRLQASSPAIGQASWSRPGGVDLEGKSQVGTADLGAYEYHPE